MMITKECKDCKQILCVSNFNKNNTKNGYKNICKKCNAKRHLKYNEEHKEQRKEYQKTHYQQNKEKISKRHQNYYKNNPDKIKKIRQDYLLNDINKEKMKEYHKQYAIENKEKMKEYQKTHYQQNKEKILKRKREYKRNRYLQDNNFKLIINLRNRLIDALKHNYKSKPTLILLGCSINYLKMHLQQTAIKNGYIDFDINNYSGKKYHIDHIIPCDCFDLTKPEEQEKCFNWSNLQILTAKENLIKGNKIFNNNLNG